MSDPVVIDNDPAPAADPSILASRAGANALVSVLVQRLGGSVLLTPEDLHGIQGSQLLESNEERHTGRPDGEAIVIRLVLLPDAGKGAMQ